MLPFYYLCTENGNGNFSLFSAQGKRVETCFSAPFILRTTAASSHAYVQCTVLRYITRLMYRNKPVLS